ncbi:MAG: hypothetical protein WD040_02285 [Anaerolineales bacterium]
MRTPHSIAAITFILAMVACGLPSPSDAPTEPAAVVASPTPSPEPEAGGIGQLAPLPASMSQAVSAGVRDGLWS